MRDDAIPKRLEGAASNVNDLARVVSWWLCSLSQKDLLDVREFLGLLTQTNCSWQAYWLRDSLSRFVEAHAQELKKSDAPKPEVQR